MLDTGCLLGSAFFVFFGVSIVLFPGVLRKVSQALDRKVVQLDVDLARNWFLRYVLGLVTIALGWSLFRLSLFLPVIGN